ncbi:MAG: aminotransferase class I/II-fold pyridoxal phosphate-dependent enzyme [Candidatus Krumholzibacteria bacterium]|nr:aminotransferase class I/II-fold pyridoxal phosphate-dependent enzyme [Candidatus Krumholzibacteria bacterium]
MTIESLSRTRCSDYITWAKQRPAVRYDLARSGVPSVDLAPLVPSLDYVLAQDRHEEGWPPLVERIAGRYGVEAERVVVVHGTSMANHLTCAALLDPDDDALVEHPVYDPLAAVPRYLGARVIPFARPATAGFAPDLGAIRRAVTPRTRLIVLSDLHNPSGARLDDAALSGLEALATANDCRVLVDEVYLEFLYARGARTAARRSERFVTTRSLTKAYGLDRLRVGWIIAEPALAERMRRLHDLFAAAVSHPAERLAAVALAHADALLAPTVARLDAHRAIVEDFVGAQPRLSWTPPAGGTVGFIRLDGGGVDALVERLVGRHDTIVTPGRFFGAGDCFRIGWGLETDVLEEALTRVGRALAEQ